MEELKEAKTRSLDAFEKKALTGLEAGEDVMVLVEPQRMRMLSAVRALRQCLQCHAVERGDLLGAFSYRLRLEKPGEAR